MTSNKYYILVAALTVLAASVAYSQEPRTKLTLALPKYEVVTHETLDYVRIPGGRMLIEEEGRPLVPFYVEYLDYPRGCRVQDVVLKERSAADTATGLRLPVVILDMQGKEPVAMTPGLYPDRKHTWRVIDLPGGGSKLAVAVYPFDYEPKATRVTYHRSYDFDIKYVRSSVALAELTSNKDAYAPSEVAELRLKLENTGPAQNVTALASLLVAATGEEVKTLPGLALAVKPDTSSAAIELPTRGIPNGDYYADVGISDAQGNVLDRKQVGLRIGIPAGEQSGFEATPPHFRIGDVVKLSLGFKNTGSTSLSGQAVFEVRVKDSTVSTMTREFQDLAPGESRRFADSWPTGKADKNVLYRAIGYVSYEATTTPANQVVISTNLAPSAAFSFAPDTVTSGQEVSFDAGAATDDDGRVVKYEWEFGDGGEAEGVTVKHTFHEPGEFVVTLTVTDDGGRSAAAARTLQVNE